MKLGRSRFSGFGIRSLLPAFAKNAILTLFGFFLAFMIIEGVLRLHNPLGFRIKGNKIVLPVNRTQIIHNKKDGRLDELVVNRKNSLGFRGPEKPVDFGSWLTIVTVGGSTTECLALNEGQSWPCQLENKLKQPFPRVWLNNAGLGGHSTFGHLVLLQDFLINIKPKAILFLVGLNDMGRGDGVEKEKLRNIGKNWEMVLAASATHSEAASVLLNLYRFYFPAYVRFTDIKELDIQSLQHLEIPFSKEGEIIENHRQKYLPSFQERLERLVKLAREHQIDPVLITQPVLYGEVVDEITGVDLGKIDVYGITNGKTGWKVLELYNEVTRQVGINQGVLVIDLARELPKNSQYYYDLVHYSNEGSEKVAGIIYSHLAPTWQQNFPTIINRSNLFT